MSKQLQARTGFGPKETLRRFSWQRACHCPSASDFWWFNSEEQICKIPNNQKKIKKTKKQKKQKKTPKSITFEYQNYTCRLWRGFWKPNHKSLGYERFNHEREEKIIRRSMIESFFFNRKMTGFPETQSFSTTSILATGCDWFFWAKWIWLRVTGFLKNPWLSAKCIWQPITRDQMHLATNHPSPNAFGHPPAKIPKHEEFIMFCHDFAWKVNLHVSPKPDPKAANVVKRGVSFISQLAKFLSGLNEHYAFHGS